MGGQHTQGIGASIPVLRRLLLVEKVGEEVRGYEENRKAGQFTYGEFHSRSRSADLPLTDPDQVDQLPLAHHVVTVLPKSTNLAGS